jgi:hypothetical protein
MSLFGPRSDPVREMYDPERADFNLRFLLRQFFFLLSLAVFFMGR